MVYAVCSGAWLRARKDLFSSPNNTVGKKRFLWMIFNQLRIWWRSLPSKARVQIIAAMLLVFAGTEVFVLAPYIFDIAVMIDVGGLVMVIAAFRSSVSVSMMQVRALLSVALKPIVAVSRVGEGLSEFGGNISPNWYRCYILVDRIATRSSAALIVLAFGVAVARLVVGMV